ncbi:MAG: TonB family protein [Pseudomonadota bacterium]|jgi:protein TonB|nr:TonB family protein [Pseudomonadota bacterium]MEC7095130.1 TonB family protein [Pseudomonadota bacterium]MEC7493263.1 TonB family protein [Pseudomonadota bacterium]MEC8166810.1 TonB family protein [Pseudomonadota bacterium]MEC8529094.1 TonB family protein [Pseudomonadota bacterium]
MSSLVRTLIGVCAAVPIALGLFFLMNSLIDRQFEQDEIKAQKVAEIVVPDKEIETNRKEELPEKVEDPDEPPPDMEPLDFDTDLDMSTANMAPAVAVNVSINASGLSSGDGEYLPIVKVAPIYPRRAQTRGITGYCIVTYTVTTTGAIRDPYVENESDCSPKGIFERASLKAAAKFKYKPRVVDGQAIEVAGVQNKFTYELEGGRR